MRLVSLLFVVLFLSCKNESTNIEALDKQKAPTELIIKSDIESLKYLEFLPDQKVVKQINNWEKYNELERLITDVKNTDFSFFRNNKEIVNTLCQELKETLPESMNTPQILSRLITLETKIFKLESLVNLSNPNKIETLEGIKEFLIAFSNLNLQMNKKVEKESQNIQKPN